MHWHKSSYSDQQGGNCVEVAETESGAYVRDTQNRENATLAFGGAEWASLVADLKTGAL
ncbi:uncharacterized protein DUF397 [Murinocardiopsis flavida]|uniref:Uncharacterized protein DUF397 n=1 Tax=Murinocardiopsis flavida TaxID=645275 RepID=A0A2P8DFL6_9ACTN|nr:DUF397 domain-containing protein [Murinocardiopsis flavida]PSK96005.1 uncharacterized protein DUF397 [Murinocardiopsis flavida]